MDLFGGEKVDKILFLVSSLIFDRSCRSNVCYLPALINSCRKSSNFDSLVLIFFFLVFSLFSAGRYELGRQPANTKPSSNKTVRRVRVRGGNVKWRALRLDTGNYSWGGGARP